MLPLAAEALTQEDWEAIDAAFASNNDPVVGVPASKAFRELFRHLDRHHAAAVWRGTGGGGPAPKSRRGRRLWKSPGPFGAFAGSVP